MPEQQPPEGAGYSKHSTIHTTHILELSSDLPIVVTVIDQTEAITAFLPMLQEMVKEGLITQESVTIVHHAPAIED